MNIPSSEGHHNNSDNNKNKGQRCHQPLFSPLQPSLLFLPQYTPSIWANPFP